jgi:hypothetical protein
MIRSVPVVCRKCGNAFAAEIPFGLGPGTTLVLSGGGFATCPVCSELNVLNDVAYRVTSDAVEVFSGPGIARSSIEELMALAEQAATGRISRAQAIAQVAAISPTYATIFEAFEKFGLPGLNLLVTILGVCIAYSAMKSSSDDMKKIEDAAAKQTLILEQVIEAIKKQPVVSRVEGESAAPPSPNAEQQSSPVKAPQKRPTKVRKRGPHRR